MMKKMFAVMLIAALVLSCATAFAATYTDPDREITFEYDDTVFDLSEDIGDDEVETVLSGKVADWGEANFIRFHLADLEDGESFPTMQDFQGLLENDTEVTQGDWNGLKNVFMYGYDVDDYHEDVFIVPIYDHDNPSEVEDILTINVGITQIEDEGASMARSDLISAVLDTLKVRDD